MLTYIYILIVFLISAFIIYVLINGFIQIYKRFKVKNRLTSVSNNNIGSESLIAKLSSQKILGLINHLSRLSLPKEGWQDSKISIKFIQAGLREHIYIKIFYAIKTFLFFLMPLTFGLYLLLLSNLSALTILAYTFIIGTLGFYLPDYFLYWKIKIRTQDIEDNLPDLVDLLVISTEAGLGFDAAINRISKEIGKTSIYLAEEFYLANLEVRAGSQRATALKNLALRVHLDDLSQLISMLIQADKFGTSLAESLRIHSEVMRTKRFQRAEEKAAKIPVKMLFPLAFCIFPSLLIAVIGAAVIQLSSAFN